MADLRLETGPLPAVLAAPELRWIPIIRVIIIIIIIITRQLCRLWRNAIRGSSSRKRPDLSRRKWTSIRPFRVTIAAPPRHPASIEQTKTAITTTTNRISIWKRVPFTAVTPKAITPPSISTVASKRSRSQESGVRQRQGNQRQRSLIGNEFRFRQQFY